MTKLKQIFILLTLFFVAIIPAQSQTIKELQRQKRQAQAKLTQTRRLLNKTQKSKKGTEKEISILSKSIKESNNLIFTINSELDGLSRDISKLEEEKGLLNQKLELIKKDYAKMLERSEIYRRQFSPILFVFSSKNFVQGIRRARYVVEMAECIKRQVAYIKETTNSIADKENALQNVLSQKTNTLKQKEIEQNNLNSQKKRKNRLLQRYKHKEKQYANTIKQTKAQQKHLNNLIRKKVAEENRRKAEQAKKAEQERLRRERERQKAKNRKKTDKKETSTEKNDSSKPIISDKEYKQYTEDKALTGDFAKNKGALPMPVAKGKIHRSFGQQTNPLTKAKEYNSGIYILSPDGTEARAVFDGTVFEVMYEPGSGYIIWITHGSFSTVYAQLSLFYVKKGDKVKAKQRIGKIAKKNDNTELNFYILNEKASYENPQMWLSY